MLGLEKRSKVPISEGMTLRMTDGTFPSSVSVTIRVMKEFIEVMPSFFLYPFLVARVDFSYLSRSSMPRVTKKNNPRSSGS